MLRAKAHVAYAICVAGCGNGSIVEQKRYSFKYAHRSSQDEMRQPFYIHEKYYGIFSNEHNIRKPRRGLPYITPLYTKHMNLWETDTDASTNRYFQSYVFGQRELSQLLGRPHGFEADDIGGRQGASNYELNHDQRYMGVTRPAITNLYYEPEWRYTLYRNNAHGNHLTNYNSLLTKEVLGSELLEIRDIKSLEHCKAWFDRLQYLIKLHYDAVGDIGEFKSRHTWHVHEFFVAFHDALSSFNFQDRYLFEQFQKVRPKELEDLFGIFLEMEGNYVNEDYCPRCSLPYTSTRYCGEGDTTTPFRKHRGRWAPHQRWGKEWRDVVVRRAEALWYRATEDPYFGVPAHTQRQIEALLNVYIKTMQRAKAVDFMTALRGSKEFLLGDVQITENMQVRFDHLLDHTPHQHLLTNAFRLDSRAAVYTGESNALPLSPLQVRLDLEVGKYRRQQKEEGVVRVPPALWRLDTSALVPYRLDAGRQVTNWREVKEGIERSFLSVGLPKEAYTGQEWREMLYWKDCLARQAKLRAELEAQRQHEESTAAKQQREFITFPDRYWYRVFDTSAEALCEFGISGTAIVFKAIALTFEDATAVPYSDHISGVHLRLNTTPEACRWYGDFEYGDVVTLGERDSASGGADASVIVVGVNTTGPEGEWTLYAMYADPTRHAREGLLELGKDCLDIKHRFQCVHNTHQKRLVHIFEGNVPLPLSAEQQPSKAGAAKLGVGGSSGGGRRVINEECLGQVVGVRNGELYVQWRLLKGGGSCIDRSVAVSLGTPEMVKQLYRIKALNVEPLVEPPSWQTPFRNDFAEERLKKLQTAPFQRESWASLIPGKYTPKVKRFGYAQHTTQNDFETKEYKDRLLARQYFNNPQAFEVIPERRESSVRFGGKWEYQRTHGFPTVDRNELENGWGELEPISDGEMNAIEQALRDISGRRPGNFAKAPTETQSLRLNESWWTPLKHGWEEHNLEQRAFFDSSEQKIIESTRLPFKGKVPPFGTTYGIGERIREVTADFSKGFGLGPHGHSPTHDTSSYNTLGAEVDRVQTLGLSHPLVRIFDEKLGGTDPHAWALEQCGQDQANVRHLLLSLREWRERGRAPSLLLATILGQYLKVEIDAYNAGLPKGVPQLQLPAAPAVNNTGDDPNHIWASVDAKEYGYEYVQHRGTVVSDEALIPHLVQCAQLGAISQGLHSALFETTFSNAMQNEFMLRFRLQLAKIAGKGIPPALLASVTGTQQQRPRHGGNVVPYVHASELVKLLRSVGVSSENIAVAIRELSNCPEHRRLGTGMDDFIVPISLVMTWIGSGGSTTVERGGKGGERAAAASRVMHSGRLLGAKGRDADMMVHVLEELQLRDDGAAADIRYVIRENKRNPVLRQEFFNAFLPVYGMNHVKVGTIYDDYCEGKFVPNLCDAIDAFVAFLGNFCKRPEQLVGQVEYFEVDTTGRHPGQYTQVKLLPPDIGPFVFDNIKCEVIQTTDIFQRYGIVAGPTSVRATSFIAPNSKDFNYFANRKDSLVRLTPGNREDYNRLHEVLTRSPDYRDIASHQGLQLLLKSASGAGLVVSFNRFFYRVAPMLTYFEAVLMKYSEKVSSLRSSARLANYGLARAIENEMSPTIEQEFRRNSERYWRNVLDGRHHSDETATATPQAGSDNFRVRKSESSGPVRDAAFGGSSSTSNFLRQALGDTRGSATPSASSLPSVKGNRTSDAPSTLGKPPQQQSGSTQNSRTESVLKALKIGAYGGSGAKSSSSNSKGGTRIGGDAKNNQRRK